MQLFQTAILLLGTVLVAATLFIAIFVRKTQTMTFRAKMRMGNFVKIVHEGWCIVVPILHSLSEPFSLQSVQYAITVTTTTKDKVAVSLLLNVAIRVQRGKEEQAMFNLADPVPQIESHVGKVALALVPTMDLDTLYGDSGKVIAAIATDISKFLNDNGYDILSVNLNGITLPDSVQKSRDAVYVNTQLQIAAKAAGETAAVLVLAAAEADKIERQLDGEGVGEERMAIADASVVTINELSEALELEDAPEEEKKELHDEITKLLNRQLELATLVKVGTSTGTVLVFQHNLGVTDKGVLAA
ncbi:MAG: SPFH domain-containing protein [Candidatus Obscuribacterales bacterium]|nr:SPFH domain-containing protein [Candidatus Obscuribacterales bacterium]